MSDSEDGRPRKSRRLFLTDAAFVACGLLASATFGWASRNGPREQEQVHPAGSMMPQSPAHQPGNSTPKPSPRPTPSEHDHVPLAGRMIPPARRTPRESEHVHLDGDVACPRPAPHNVNPTGRAASH